MNKKREWKAADLIRLFAPYIVSWPQEEEMDFTVRHISYLSKEEEADGIFFCKGAHFEKAYLEEAIQRGARLYVAEKSYDVPVPAVIVSQIRPCLFLAAPAFYGHPEREMEFYAITGTKGKSTTAFFLFSILQHAMGEGRVGLLSSITNFDGREAVASQLTTPEPFELYRLLAACRENGVEKMVMEVSSQALKYGRTQGLDFHYGGFLNISPDHISAVEHPDFADYFHSKLKIFDQSRHAFVVLGEEEDKEILDHASSCRQLTTLALSGSAAEADYLAEAIHPAGEGGLSFTLSYPKEGGRGREAIELSNPACFNAENALMAAAMAMESGISPRTVSQSLKKVEVPGRMEFFFTDDRSVGCLVDYAHNRLSYQALASYLEESLPGYYRLILFGCPGGKALNRRKELGEAAGQHADYLILTEEDSNYEETAKITGEIRQAAQAFGKPIEEVMDREEAVDRAFEVAWEKRQEGKEVLVLLLGKGREDSHKVKGRDLPCPSDYDLAVKFIRILNKKSADSPFRPLIP